MKNLRFFNGHVVLANAVIDSVTFGIDAGRIVAISDATADEAVDLAGGWVVPGFIDTQVNGGGGILFNDAIDVDGIAGIAAAHRRFGTTALLPTLISDTPERIALALDAVDAAIGAGVPGVVGVHIEGPFLNVARKGIHDAGKFRSLSPELIALLIRPRRGRVVVTLAPEQVSLDDIHTLVAGGVRVSAGHTDASEARMRAAFDAGLSGITHLFNAMAPLHQRAPGPVGAALDDPRPWCGLIVDRVHVAPVLLRIALRARGLHRMMLVTDAMPSVGMRNKDFVLQGRKIRVENGVCAFEDGTLAGSDLDMASAFANTVTDLGLSPAEAALLAATNPAAFLGLEHERGMLAEGLRADLVQLDATMKPVTTWIAGKGFHADEDIRQ